VLALRQPGSAIKPFTYGVALEGGFSPATILADIPTHIPDEQGDYIPENYDKRYHGPVRLRTALACSYNVPAVRVAQRIGVVTLLQRLHLAGFASLTKPASYYGYGLTLGNGDVTLLELTNAYASLANGGLWKPVRLLRSVQTAAGEQIDLEVGSVPNRHRIFDERVTFLLTNILSDPVARRPAFGAAFQFPFACAVKTGTTKDYRDNWTVGFTTEYTVGVWVGNFDGGPMRGVSGLTGAGPIFSDVMMLLHQHNTPEEFPVPQGLHRRAVCPRSGKLPTKACGETIVEWFQSGDEPRERCDVHHFYRVVEAGRESIRAYEVAAPEFRAWAEQERIPTPPAGAKPVPSSDPGLQSGNHSSALRPSILYPNDGDQFKLDPVLRREYQSIKILGATPEGSTQPVLRDNDKAVAYNTSGSWWVLERGKHTLQLEASVGGAKRRSAPVTIFVE
jgi:penicillin-binding protein 1C